MRYCIQVYDEGLVMRPEQVHMLPGISMYSAHLCRGNLLHRPSGLAVAST